MKRAALLAAVLAVVACGITVGVGAAGASSSSTARVAPASPSGTAGVKNTGKITPGSQWTLYDIAFVGSADYSYGPCEVLTFDSHGVFTSDKGDVGNTARTSL